jgi:hypothetical protein
MMASTSLGSGVLSKMAVPRSLAGVFCARAAPMCCVVHHQAPSADPITAANPNILLFTIFPPTERDATCVTSSVEREEVRETGRLFESTGVAEPWHDLKLGKNPCSLFSGHVIRVDDDVTHVIFSKLSE